MYLPAASCGVSVYRRIQQAFTAGGGEFKPERLSAMAIFTQEDLIRFTEMKLGLFQGTHYRETLL